MHRPEIAQPQLPVLPVRSGELPVRNLDFAGIAPRPQLLDAPQQALQPSFLYRAQHGVVLPNQEKDGDSLSSYLNAPTVTPSTNVRWNERKSTTTGRITSVDAAISRLNLMSCDACDVKNVNPTESVYFFGSCR